MNIEVPRLRMFAGPNGSGKSVLKSYLPEPLLGVYLNPDEIEAGIKKSGYADIHRFGIQTTQEEVLPAFTGSKFLQEKGFADAAKSLSFKDGRLIFTSDVGNSYFASVLVDFIRGKLLKVRQTFTFETVMSHPGKVALLQQAQQAGYRTYLYYVATDDPEINVSPVANRVALKGHDVPSDKSSRAITNLSSYSSKRSGTQTGLIFSITPRTTPRALTLGSLRSQMGGFLNLRRPKSRHGSSTRCWIKSRLNPENSYARSETMMSPSAPETRIMNEQF